VPFSVPTSSMQGFQSLQLLVQTYCYQSFQCNLICISLTTNEVYLPFMCLLAFINLLWSAVWNLFIFIGLLVLHIVRVFLFSPLFKNWDIIHMRKVALSKYTVSDFKHIRKVHHHGLIPKHFHYSLKKPRTH
jgi:hypothetical protein